MSYEASRAVWEHSRAKGSARLVLLCIAHHYNDERGAAWPSIPTIAAETKLSDRQVTRIVKALVESGELEIIEKGNGRGQPTFYGMPLIKLTTGTTEKGDISPHKGDIAMSGFPVVIKGDISPERVTPRAEKGDIAMSPEYKELKIEEEEENPLAELERHFTAITTILPGKNNYADDWGKPLALLLESSPTLEDAKRRLERAYAFARNPGNGHGGYTVRAPVSLSAIIANLPDETHKNGHAVKEATDEAGGFYA